MFARCSIWRLDHQKQIFYDFLDHELPIALVKEHKERYQLLQYYVGHVDHDSIVEINGVVSFRLMNGDECDRYQFTKTHNVKNIETKAPTIQKEHRGAKNTSMV